MSDLWRILTEVANRLRVIVSAFYYHLLSIRVSSPRYHKYFQRQFTFINYLGDPNKEFNFENVDVLLDDNLNKSRESSTDEEINELDDDKNTSMTQDKLEDMSSKSESGEFNDKIEDEMAAKSVHSEQFNDLSSELEESNEQHGIVFKFGQII
jgi:hypothetical protein